MSAMRRRDFLHVGAGGALCAAACSPVAGAGPPVSSAATAATRSFDVYAYGAVGDGTTDDSPAFNAALADMLVAGGGILDVPPGRFLIARYCYLVDQSGTRWPSLRIRGAQGASQIICASGNDPTFYFGNCGMVRVS